VHKNERNENLEDKINGMRRKEVVMQKGRYREI
jgi:hypothetical protein